MLPDAAAPFTGVYVLLQHQAAAEGAHVGHVILCCCFVIPQNVDALQCLTVL